MHMDAEEQKESPCVPKNWRDKNYSFFCHSTCEFFPCHRGVEESKFNCLFCYCPLYAFGEACGGHFTYTSKGVKNCINCSIPHQRENYGMITAKLRELTEAAAKERKKREE